MQHSRAQQLVYAALLTYAGQVCVSDRGNAGAGMYCWLQLSSSAAESMRHYGLPEQQANPCRACATCLADHLEGISIK